MPPPPKPGLLLAQVTAIVDKAGTPPLVLAFRAAPGWQGPDDLDVKGIRYAVREARTPLQARETLLDLTREGRPLVLLTELSNADLGADVLARFHHCKVRAIDGWEAVRSLYGAREGAVDVLLLREPHLASYLIEAPPAPLPGGVLSVDIAWQVLFAYHFGLPGAISDLRALLRWCASGTAERLREAPTDLRDSAVARLEKVCGPSAAPLLAGALDGHAADMLPLGLACAVLFADAAADLPDVQSARVRLERFTGGGRVEEAHGRAWADAASAVLQDIEAADPGSAAEWLQRADDCLDELRATAAAFLSPISPRGFDQRLERFAQALRGALDDPAATAELGHQPERSEGETSREAGGKKGVRSAPPLLSDLTAAADEVRAHRLAHQQPARVERVRMATRLVGWLATPQNGNGDLLAAEASAYIQSGAFVDWARERLVGGEPLAPLARAFRTLFERVTERREEENRRFSEALRQWSVAGTGGGVLPIENVLSAVLAPLVRSTRVLLVVLDGMSWGVAHELVSDLLPAGWVALTSDAVPGAPVIAALPTVTEVSRASLLAGVLTRGDSTTEKDAFGRHPELRAACRADTPPQLFHRAELDETAEPWDSTLLTRIDIERYKIIGVVVNAVDDHLAKDGQILHPWKLDTIRPLRTLMDRAAHSGRVVVLASDHGHVLEYGSSLRRGNGGERWRTDGAGPQADEVAITGPRVLLGESGETVLPWSERVRYGPKKWGYHGGATPQEVLIPLMVLASPGKVPAGWKPVPLTVPSWWDPLPIEAVSPRTLPPARRRNNVAGPPDTLQSLSLAHPPPWLDAVIQSSAMTGQLGRLDLDIAEQACLARLLKVMSRAEGRLTTAAAARLLEVTEPDLRGFLQRAERVLNVDGYSTLSLGVDGETVQLNLDLLQRVFLGADVRRIRAQTPQGQTIEFVIPFEPTDLERKALEALARHGTLGEAELSRAAGTRRVGFFETLVQKLSRAGWNAIEPGETGPSGCTYTLRREQLP